MKMLTEINERAIDVGTTVRITKIFEGLAFPFSPIIPTTVGLALRAPDGNEILPRPSVVITGTLYYSDVVVDRPGQWRYRWFTTGPQLVSEGSILVRRSEYEIHTPPVPPGVLTWGEFEDLTWGEFEDLTWGEF